jgi:hypothetical protein
MADRFWIGGTGNTSDTAHWSTTSGGSGGASKPTSADSVYFDANSFSEAGQTVTINATINCLDMDWTGAKNSPTLAGSSALNIYGSLTFIVAMNDNAYDGTKNFYGTTTGLTITSNGHLANGQINFNSLSGEWILQDNLIRNYSVSLLAGTLNTNNKMLRAYSFTSNYTTTRKLVLGSSIITCSPGDWNLSTVTNLALTAGTSTIKLTGDSKTFAGGGLTYNNVEFQGTPTTITGSNTFNELKVASGKTAKLTAGTTQTVASLVIDGATLQSATTGTPATISKASGTVEVTGATIKDITATGGATFNAINSTNVSGNTGWNWITRLKQMSMGMSMGMGL